MEENELSAAEISVTTRFSMEYTVTVPGGNSDAAGIQLIPRDRYAMFLPFKDQPTGHRRRNRIG